MRKILVFQHVPAEPLGTLDRTIREAGFRIRFVNFDREPDWRAGLDRYHGLVVLGGPMAANQTDRYPHLAFERDTMAEAVRRGLPVLGICLGAQLLAAAIGGRNLRGKAPEHGWVPVTPTKRGAGDPLIHHLRAEEPIFQWHSDTFTLPSDAVHLATSPTCRYQAFRFGDAAYGLQFHLEASRPLIERWLAAAASKPHGPRLDTERMLADSDRLLPRALALGTAVFGAFVERFYSFRRRHAHASR